MNPLKSYYFWIIWIVSSPVAYMASVILLMLILSWTPSHNFTAEKWLENPQERTELIDNLIDSKRLDGLSKLEVIKLLGDPLEDCSYFRHRKWDMIYHLGPERGFFGIDSEWLLIWFENGKVCEYEIRTD